jgi:alkylhydroperoxidase family enzyme
VALGRSAGISDDEMAAMPEAQSSPLFDETDKLVIRYAEVLTQTCKVSDDLYRQLEARFTREELLELCFLVGLAALVNRVHATFVTDVDAVTRASVGDAPFCPIGR